ncbi:NACHT, LRR and PYD domains-containing protein 3-like [Polypterus senegalus]|uniref:NACHT, LRR and PYD domains-containing protein 3-like n=1 Tax=Polypterus senegalus TaxID=55291 RepID=UPI001962739D|nr:NACHT, LRR and PYD domains-containing protein 3-like [Polypterus senegalus]
MAIKELEEDIGIIQAKLENGFDATLLEFLKDKKDSLRSLLDEQLTPSTKEELDLPLSLEELTSALGSLNQNKAPGIDGLPVEFYKSFWNILALALRLRTVMNCLVAFDQSYCVPERCIFDNIFFVRDLVSASEILGFKVVAYADDVTVVITEPDDVVLLQDCLQVFQTVSSARVNWSKFQIKAFCQQYTQQVTKRSVDQMKSLEEDITELHATLQNSSDKDSVEILTAKKHSLSQRLELEAKGALVRSRFQNLNHLDAPTRFCFSLEKKEAQTVEILPVWNLRKEIALTLTFSEVINGFSHEDLLKITEYYKPQLAYVMNFDISSVLQLLINKRILTNDEAKVVKVKEQSERTPAVESFIGEVMKKDRAVLVSLWQALAEEFVRCPSVNVKGILDEVTEWGPDLLKEIQSSAQSPTLEPQIKDLHEKHRLSMSESTRPLDDQRQFGDPHTSAVGLETQYTELMVIKQDIKDKLAKAGKTQERLDEVEATKTCERVWTEQLFKRRPKSKTPPKIIVVSGVVGIGKTTMVQKIMSDWARGTEYQRFAFVFLFKFRELNLLDDEPQMSLTTLIERHYKHLTHDKLIEILKKPESLLFILDGLEEYKHKLDFTDTQLCSKPDDEVPVHILVTSLVSQTLLKGCSVLITSSPTALESLDMERVDGFVELVGFLPEQRLMYFKKFFGDAALGTKYFQCMESNTILYSMCANPSYCWIICSALKSHFMTPEKERGAAPRTVTETFVMFLHNILTNHRQEAEDQRRILISLGKMAYYGVDNRVHVFNEKQEMSTFGLQPVLSSLFLSGFLQRQHTLEHTMYTFYQFTLQEFMAAFSFYLDPSGGVEELLKKQDLCKGGRFEIVTRFLAGLAWCPVIKTLEGILGEFEGTTTQRIQEWVRQKAKQALQWGGKSEALQVCHWLYETQNEEVIRDAIRENLNMSFISMTLSALDCAVLASVISCCGELQGLNLSDTPLTPECIRRLEKGISCCSIVWLHSCGLTARCCSALSFALSAPNSRLTELMLDNNNNMEDSGVEQLCEGLSSPNCKLKTLCLVSCGLTARCCSALSFALSAPNSRLTELRLGGNNMEDSGVEQLCEGLGSPNCKLEKLNLVSCGLTARCCSALSFALSAPNSRLSELRLGFNNNMEDSGVEQLCEGLSSPNCKLKTLW